MVNKWWLEFSIFCSLHQVPLGTPHFFHHCLLPSILRLILYNKGSCRKRAWPLFIYSFSFSEKALAPHSSTLAWKIPWTEEPGRLLSMGSHRVGHDWAASLSLVTFIHWRRKWQATPVFLPENPRDGGAWWAAVYGVTQSRTRLKQLSSSSSSSIQF